MSLADEIRNRTRAPFLAPSGIEYTLRAVWPIDLHRDGVLPKGTLSAGRSPRELDDDEAARLESSLLRRGIVNLEVFDGLVPEGIENGIAIQDLPNEDRPALVAEISKRSGLLISEVPVAAAGDRFRGDEGKAG